MRSVSRERPESCVILLPMKKSIEVSTSIGISALAIALMILNAQSTFTGPDAETYGLQGSSATTLAFWLDPLSLDANYWPPGIAVIRASVITFLGENEQGLQALQVVASITIAWLAWFMVRRLGSHVRLLTLAAVLFSPAIWWMANNSGYEVWLSLFLTLSISLIWMRGPSRPSQWASMSVVGAGLAWGAAFLVQSKVLVVLPVLLFLAWQWGRQSRILFILSALALPIVWAFRNLLITGTPNPISRNGSMNMWIGNNPQQLTGGFMEPPALLIEPIGPLDIYASNALNWWISQPYDAFALLLRKASRLLAPPPTQFDALLPEIRVALTVYTISFTALVLAAFLAYAFGRLWGVELPKLSPVMWFVVFFFLVHLPFLAEPRFLAPIAPAVIVVAVPTIPTLFQRRLRVRSSS